MSFLERAQSKCETWDYMDHIPRGGDRKVGYNWHYNFLLTTWLYGNFSVHDILSFFMKKNLYSPYNGSIKQQKKYVKKNFSKQSDYGNKISVTEW